uniref:DUF4113 domain-containing protein n=1 Tax=Heterorhabditis bacteriophora TaxID=37862 RepID=A0A1I7WVQ8_HETBA
MALKLECRSPYYRPPDDKYSLVTNCD